MNACLRPPLLRLHRASRVALLCLATCTIGMAAAQTLEQLRPRTGREETNAVNSAIHQCVAMIKEKTGGGRISMVGPCHRGSREWTGLERTDDGFRLRFSITPSGTSSGTLISAIKGDAVRVFCTADAKGQVTNFEEVPEGLRESFNSNGLCWPAGD